MAGNSKIWVVLGPFFVIIGAGLWGTETYFRVHLNAKFDSEVLVFYEHLYCIAFTLPFFFWNLKGLKKIPRSAWIYLLLSGSVGSAIGTTFFTLGLRELNPSVANILLNFQPVVSVLFAHFLLKEKLGRGFLFWATVALASGFVIASNGFNLSGFEWSLGLIYIGITALAWGFSTVAGRGTMAHIPLQVATGGRFIIGAIVLFLSLLIKGKFNSEIMVPQNLTDSFVIENFLWLSFVAGVLPLYFYFKGLQYTSASVGGFCELTQTFSALVLTWGIMGHSLTLLQVIAGLVLIAAVYMISFNYAKANQAY